MHKTGTSSIQHSLHGLSDARFLYADLGPDPNHSLAIYSLFAAEPGRHPLHRGRRTRHVGEYDGRVRALLDAAIAAAGERTLIISGEGIGRLEPEALAALA